MGNLGVRLAQKFPEQGRVVWAPGLRVFATQLEVARSGGNENHPALRYVALEACFKCDTTVGRRLGRLVGWAWVQVPTPTGLMNVTEHVSSFLCTFPEGSDGDNNSQRVLWAEGTAYAKALRWDGLSVLEEQWGPRIAREE